MPFLSIDPSTVKQFRDTDYYVSENGGVYHKWKSGYKQINGRIRRNKREGTRVYFHLSNCNICLQRLVWITYRGEIPDGYIIVHKNGCPTMNDLQNLELVEYRQNNKYRKQIKTARKVYNLKSNEIYRSTREASRILKRDKIAIKNSCDGNYVQGLKLAWYDSESGHHFNGDYHEHMKRYNKRSESGY